MNVLPRLDRLVIFIRDEKSPMCVEGAAWPNKQNDFVVWTVALAGTRRSAAAGRLVGVRPVAAVARAQRSVAGSRVV
jgi:hypothetical protein